MSPYTSSPRDSKELSPHYHERGSGCLLRHREQSGGTHSTGPGARTKQDLSQDGGWLTRMGARAHTHTQHVGELWLACTHTGARTAADKEGGVTAAPTQGRSSSPSPPGLPSGETGGLGLGLTVPRR